MTKGKQGSKRSGAVCMKLQIMAKTHLFLTLNKFVLSLVIVRSNTHLAS